MALKPEQEIAQSIQAACVGLGDVVKLVQEGALKEAQKVNEKILEQLHAKNNNLKEQIRLGSTQPTAEADKDKNKNVSTPKPRKS